MLYPNVGLFIQREEHGSSALHHPGLGRRLQVWTPSLKMTIIYGPRMQMVLSKHDLEWFTVEHGLDASTDPLPAFYQSNSRRTRFYIQELSNCECLRGLPARPRSFILLEI